MTSRASIPRAVHSPYRTMLEVIRRINPANFLYAAEIAQHTLTLAQLRPAVNDYFFILCERTKGSLCRRRATIGYAIIIGGKLSRDATRNVQLGDLPMEKCSQTFSRDVHQPTRRMSVLSFLPSARRPKPFYCFHQFTLVLPKALLIWSAMPTVYCPVAS